MIDLQQAEIAEYGMGSGQFKWKAMVLSLTMSGIVMATGGTGTTLTQVELDQTVVAGIYLVLLSLFVYSANL